MDIISKIYTFIIYLVVIISSTFFVELANKNINRNKKSKFYIYTFSAIILPCVLAGFRGETVGVDVQTYSMSMFELAKHSSVAFFATYGKSEMAFSALVYIATKLTGSIVGVHFAIALFQIIPIYIISYLCRDRFPMGLPMFTYYCIDYLMGYNTMRQEIACSLVLLAFVLFCYKKNFFYIIACCILAVLFHNSAVIGIVIIITGVSIFKTKKKIVRNILIATLLLLLIIIVFNWEIIANNLISVGLIKTYSSYIGYLNGTNSVKSAMLFHVGTTAYIDSLYKLLFLFVPILIMKIWKVKLANVDLSALYICFFAVIVYWFFFITLKTMYIYRITMYGEYFFILVFPSVYSYKKRNKPFTVKGRNLVCNLLLISYVAIVYCYLGQHGVTPYCLL